LKADAAVSEAHATAMGVRDDKQLVVAWVSDVVERERASALRIWDSPVPLASFARAVISRPGRGERPPGDCLAGVGRV